MDIGYMSSLRRVLEIANGRKLIFFGLDELTKCVYADLIRLNGDVAYFVADIDDKTYEGKPIKNKFDLIYEDKEDVFIVSFVLNGHGNIYIDLKEMGFEFEKDFLIFDIAGYQVAFDSFDPLLGYNRKESDYWGFQVYGDDKDEKAIKIVLLGGSTTDPTVGGVTCWGELLYQKLIDADKNVVIYNGGIGGYTANKEFYKLIRDGLRLNPDIVLSFDGFNDVNFWTSAPGYPYLNNYEKKVYDYIQDKGNFAPDTLQMRNAKKIMYGMPDQNISDHQHWMNCIRQMHAICEEFDIQYYSFLQPMIHLGSPVLSDPLQKIIDVICKSSAKTNDLLKRMPEFYCEVKEFVSNRDYTYDLTEIFDGEENVYYDVCHSTQYGHKIIAQSIFDVLMQDEKGRKRCAL